MDRVPGESSGTAQADLQTLFSHLMSMAHRLLASNGGFYPFGAAMHLDGQTTLVQATDGTEFPDSEALPEMMVESLREQAREPGLRATALCFDVRVVPPGQADATDAIAARLEHQSGTVRDIFTPYRKCETGEMEFGESFASGGMPQVFT